MKIEAIEKLERIANGEDVKFESDDLDSLTSNFAQIAIDRYNNKRNFLSNNVNILDKLGGLGSNNYNPLLAQSVMNSNNNSRIPNQQKLSKWLSSPQEYSTELKQASEYFYNVSMQYRRAISHLGKILLYNYTLNPIKKPVEDTEEELNKFKESYYQSLEYLPKLNIKYVFPRITQETLKDGVAYYYYTEGEDFASFLKLPNEYCYITGTWDWGYTFAMDLTYFDKFGGQLKKSCPELAKAYSKFIALREAYKNETDKNQTVLKSRYYRFAPTNGLAIVGDDVNHSINPILQGVFKDILEIDEYKRLTKSKTILDTFKLIVQEIPYDKNGDPYVGIAAAKKMVEQTKKILPENVGIVGTPLANSQSIDFTDGAQSQNNIVGRGEQQFWRNVGTSGMIMDTAQNTSKIVEYGLINDYSFVEGVQNQLENFINLRLMKLTKDNDSVYYNRVKFFGNRYTNDNDTKDYMQLVQTANMPVAKLFAYAGYEPFEVEPSVILENEIGLKETMKAIIPGAQQSGSAGRPEEQDSEIGDAADETRDRDSGEERRM